MKKIYVLLTFLLYYAIAGSTATAQTTLNTVTLGNASYNGSNGAGSNTWITFVLENNSGSPIMLTDVGNFYNTGENGVVELWYSSTSLGGNPTALIAPDWTMIATTNLVVTSNGVTPVFTGLSFIIPNNTEYRFAVWSAAYTHYSGAAGPPAPSTFTSGGVTLKVGDVQIGGANVGYGGSNNPRWFTGSVTFMPALPCVAPPTAGTAAANPTNACGGSNVTLSLSGNSVGLTQTYQWQSGPSSTGPWTNIGSAIASPSIIVNPTSSAYYRCGVTCGASTVYSSTVQVTVPPLFPGGTYTINSGAATGGTNFNNFTDAVNAISCGIAGPVTFNVATGSGPYNEQITIPDIPTTSSTNTITFNGNGATLTYASTNTNERACMKLDGADYITINNLVVAPTGTYGFGIQLLNDADNNTINGCTINNDVSSTSSNYAGIVVSGSASSATTSGSNCDNITISNNTVIGGYYGITCLGNAAPSLTNNNQIIDNDVREFYYYGIYTYANNNLLVARNEVSRPTRSTISVFYGILLSTYTVNSTVSQNYVHTPAGGNATSTSTHYGITVSSADATVGNENKIFNNLVVFENGNGTQYGLYNSGADYAQFYHNTVSLENTASTAGTTRGFYQTTAATGIDFKNNIINITRGGSGAKHAIYINNASTVVTANNNNYYMNASGGTSYVGYFTGPGNLSTLANWQTSTSNDANTLTENPTFISSATGNYTPNNAALDNMGTPVGITVDLMNVPRSATTPDIGAYEFTAVPLSVSLKEFTATAVNEDVAVKWTVASEADINKYVVERSDNGINFTETGSVSEVANSKHTNSYSYNDVNAQNAARDNKLYYRLRIEDVNGAVQYSQTAAVQFGNRSMEEIAVYPNPFSDKIRVRTSFESEQIVLLSLRDITGKTIVQQKVATGGNAGDIVLDGLNDLTNGVYELNIEWDGGSQVYKLIK